MKRKHSLGFLSAIVLALVLWITPIYVFAAATPLALNQAVEDIAASGITKEYEVVLEQETRAILYIDFYDVPEDGSSISYIFSSETDFISEAIPVSRDGTYSKTILLPAGTSSFSITGYAPAVTYIFSFDEATCDILGHEFSLNNTIPSTCITPGYSGDQTCKYCGHVQAGEEMPLIPHDLVLTNELKPTCQNTGYSGDQVCSVCKYTEKGTELPVTDHDYILINDSLPTCTTEGYTGDTVCTTCDYLVPGEKQEIIDHEWSIWTTLILPTYREEGLAQRNCIMCDMTQEKSIDKIVSKPIAFEDIEKDEYYYNSLVWAYNQEITDGTDATHFSPSTVCNRAQMVTFLWRIFTMNETSHGTNPFVDVPKGSFFYDATLWAEKNGITTGTSATTFSPNQSVSRAQVVTFLWRATGEPTTIAKNSFTDIPEHSYYTNAVLWATETGITVGTGNSQFSPDAPCTRAQIVTFLCRWLAPAEAGDGVSTQPPTESESPEVDSSISDAPNDNSSSSDTSHADYPTGEGDIKYVLNQNTNKFHRLSCRDVGDISVEHRKYTNATREQILAFESRKYTPCGHCDP